jgi:hypothetical protein
MDIFPLALLAAIGLWFWRSQDQGRRIALLASHLRQHQIEKLMEALTQGYLRALGEADAQRREQVFTMLKLSEQQLTTQVRALAKEFAQVEETRARVSRLPVYLPWVTQLLPPLTFDMRSALALHADGMGRVAASDGLPTRDRAFMLSAEIFLFQHTCHWFCKSRMVASARMLAAHKTAHAQLVASVSPATRTAYLALIGERA